MPDRLLDRSSSPRWEQARELAPLDVRLEIQRLVSHQAESLSNLFYQTMMADPVAGRMLEPHLVQRRLHALMARWLRELFDERSDTPSLLTAQRHAGEIHARVGVPHAVVAEGARVLKRRIAQHWRERSFDVGGAQAASAMQYVYELIDLAIDTMGAATQADAARMARTDEGYRLFALTQNLRAERERQKLQLLEWADELMQEHYWNLPSDPALQPPPRRSPFALWVSHKATLLFDDAPELDEVRQIMSTVERELLPRLRDSRRGRTDAREWVAALHRELHRLKGLLNTLFDRASGHESGRDDVTRLLNRRFLPAIIKREMRLSQASAHPFSLLLLDVDRFGQIVQALGPHASDQVLGQVAEAISDSVRAGDFVFRLGGDQFLVLAVETDAAGAVAMAESLRARVASLPLMPHHGLAPRLTVSVGVAVHDGHPDYDRQLQRADDAMRNAKLDGRDRVVLASA